MKNQSIKSLRELSRKLGKSPSTISEWVSHPCWPFPKSAPWPASIVEDAEIWAESTLDGSPRTKVELVPAPGPNHTITAEEVPTLIPLFLPTVTQDDMHRLTWKQIRAIAGGWTMAIRVTVEDYAKAQGETFSELMPAAYWQRLAVESAETDPKKLGHLFWRVYCTIAGIDPDPD